MAFHEPYYSSQGTYQLGTYFQQNLEALFYAVRRGHRDHGPRARLRAQLPRLQCGRGETARCLASPLRDR